MELAILILAIAALSAVVGLVVFIACLNLGVFPAPGENDKFARIFYWRKPHE